MQKICTMVKYFIREILLTPTNTYMLSNRSSWLSSWSMIFFIEIFCTKGFLTCDNSASIIMELMKRSGERSSFVPRKTEICEFCPSWQQFAELGVTPQILSGRAYLLPLCEVDTGGRLAYSPTETWLPLQISFLLHNCTGYFFWLVRPKTDQVPDS